MTTIAQAYIHDQRSPSEASLQEWAPIAERIAYEIAKDVFPRDVELLVQFEPGSLKTRVKVLLGSIIAAYPLVAAYPEFKHGLAEITKDAREFAGRFNERFINATGIPHDEIVRRERRTETPGRILRALNRLEDFQRRLSIDPRPEMVHELQQIVVQLRIGLSDLNSDERQIAISTIEKEHVPRLPALLVPRLALRVPDYAFDEEMLSTLALEDDYPQLGFSKLLRTDEPLDEQAHLTWQPIDSGTERE